MNLQLVTPLGSVEFDASGSDLERLTKFEEEYGCVDTYQHSQRLSGTNLQLLPIFTPSLEYKNRARAADRFIRGYVWLKTESSKSIDSPVNLHHGEIDVTHPENRQVILLGGSCG